MIDSLIKWLRKTDKVLVGMWTFIVILSLVIAISRVDTVGAELIQDEQPESTVITELVDMEIGEPVFYVEPYGVIQDEIYYPYARKPAEESQQEDEISEGEETPPADSIPAPVQLADERGTYWDCRGTVYNVVEGQCDSTPRQPACGGFYYTDEAIESLQYVALGWNMVTWTGGGPFNCGDRVYVEGFSPELDGYKIVADVSGSQRNHVDILVPLSFGVPSRSGVRVYQVD